MTVDAGTIITDVPNPDDEADGFNAFLSNLTGEEPKRPSTETEEEAPEDRGSETPEDPEDDAEGHQEGSESDPKEPDPDDAEVEVKVGDETKKATLRELKRLYGQEASLTQKSQKVAAEAQEAASRAQMAQSALNAMLERAKARYQPYADLDMLVLSQRMDTETFEQLRRDAAAAEADVKFIEQELGTHMRAEQERQAKAYQEAAQACIRELQDPEKGIPDFGKPVYDDMVTWATEKGLPEVRQIVSPAALKIVHMAMQWDRAQRAAKTAEQKLQKAPNRPTSVIKPGASKTTNQTPQRAAMQRLRQTGDIDSAADAFLASFRS